MPSPPVGDATATDTNTDAIKNARRNTILLCGILLLLRAGCANRIALMDGMFR